MEDWAEIHRLFHRERLPKATNARRLGTSRNSVVRLLGLTEPPRCVRTPQGSQVDPFAEAIAATREADSRLGHTGGTTILKEHLARIRPGFHAAHACQRTMYRPSELGQVDGWHTGWRIPIGHDWAKEAFGSLADLQAQHDAWTAEVAVGLNLCRTGTTVAGGWPVERGHLAFQPDPLPDTDLHLQGPGR